MIIKSPHERTSSKKNLKLSILKNLLDWPSSSKMLETIFDNINTPYPKQGCVLRNPSSPLDRLNEMWVDYALRKAVRVILLAFHCIFSSTQDLPAWSLRTSFPPWWKYAVGCPLALAVSYLINQFCRSIINTILIKSILISNYVF